MGRRTPVSAWTDLYMGRVVGFGAGGLGVTALRSQRLRLVFQGGIHMGGYPVMGTGVEYGDAWGGLVKLDYILVRTSWEEGLWRLKTGVYWGG